MPALVFLLGAAVVGALRQLRLDRVEVAGVAADGGHHLTMSVGQVAPIELAREHLHLLPQQAALQQFAGTRPRILVLGQALPDQPVQVVGVGGGDPLEVTPDDLLLQPLDF